LWTYFNETYHSYLLPDPRDADDIFKDMGSKVNATDDIFRKCTILTGIPVDGSQSETFSLYVFLTRVICLSIVFFVLWYIFFLGYFELGLCSRLPKNTCLQYDIMCRVR